MAAERRFCPFVSQTAPWHGRYRESPETVQTIYGSTATDLREICSGEAFRKDIMSFKARCNNKQNMHLCHVFRPPCHGACSSIFVVIRDWKLY